MWYMNAIFYELNVRAFFDADGDGHGDLQGLTMKLDYLQELGVDAIWLLPVYPSPLLDDGYDIADYYGIHPDYGSLEDFKALIDAVHQRGMKVITDLVLNHTSDQHAWFQEARQGRDNPYHDYYVWEDDDSRYSEARIIFLDTEASNWSWDEQAQRYFWHRFYSSQPDLNYDNPKVRQEMLDIARFWLELGVDGFRADAVPYLFEREGTICENLPETHAFLKELRSYIDQHYPGRILLCEANQWPEDVREYFGDGDEFHMGFHFPMMPRIFMALRKADVSPLEWVMENTPSIPQGTQWCIFLRNHDELTLEMVTETERQWMWEQFAPQKRMRLNLGIRRRLAPLLDNDLRQVELAYSLLFSLPGSPIIYYGDEIGMGDDIIQPDRNGVRTPMQWDSSPGAGFSSAAPDKLYAPLVSSAGFDPQSINVSEQRQDPGSLLNKVKQLIRARKAHPVLSTGRFSWIESTPLKSPNPIAAYLRENEEQQLLILQNLSPQKQSTHLHLPGVIAAMPITGHSDFSLENERLFTELEPYRYLWLQVGNSPAQT
jgi:maltose alpha-D-glucosyltransferase/alpha-amylase